MHSHGLPASTSKRIGQYNYFHPCSTPSPCTYKAIYKCIVKQETKYWRNDAQNSYKTRSIRRMSNILVLNALFEACMRKPELQFYKEKRAGKKLEK